MNKIEKLNLKNVNIVDACVEIGNKVNHLIDVVNYLTRNEPNLNSLKDKGELTPDRTENLGEGELVPVRVVQGSGLDQPQDWEKEFRNKWEGAQFGLSSKSMDDMVNDFKSLLAQDRKSLKEKIEALGYDMKRTHVCGFNDGESNCLCYMKALDKVLEIL